MKKEIIYKQVIGMAESCGFTRTHHGDVELWLCNKNDLESFAKLVAKEMREYMVFQATPSEWMQEHIDVEREACAKICEDRYSDHPDLSIASGEAGMCAYHIRARGEA